MIEFSMTETLIVGMALSEYRKRDMCQSDRNTCDQAFMKLQLSKKGQQIKETLRQHIGE